MMYMCVGLYIIQDVQEDFLSLEKDHDLRKEGK